MTLDLCRPFTVTTLASLTQGGNKLALIQLHKLYLTHNLSVQVLGTIAHYIVQAKCAPKEYFEL